MAVLLLVFGQQERLLLQAVSVVLDLVVKMLLLTLVVVPTLEQTLHLITLKTMKFTNMMERLGHQVVL